MRAVFVLVHSPLVGPVTWSLVAEQLRHLGIDVVVPALADTEGSAVPYWKQHAESVTLALEAVSAARPLILVGHSAAGPILPAIGQRTRRHIAAYIFSDAGLPHDGQSWLEMLRAEAPDLAARLRQHLVSGGRWPNWGDAELREVIPEDGLRQALLAEDRPRPLGFFEEPIPVFDGWPDSPCMYMAFSPPYHSAARQAEQTVRPCRTFNAGHFHMLADPVAVALTLIDLAQPALGK